MTSTTTAMTAGPDPMPGPRVGRPMRSLAAAILALGLVAGAGCGKNKGKGTTPTTGTGTGSQAGMKDGEPVGDPGPGGTGTTPGDGTNPDGTATGDGEPGQPATPAIVPPNLDISPDQARTEVTKHLATARTMLAAKTPDGDGAIREAQAALAVDGTNIEAIVVIAHANYHKRLYDTAEVILDGLLEKRKSSRNSAYLYYVYGLVYDRTNEDQKAFAAYRKAVELEPDHVSALTNLGIHQLINKQYGDAVTTFEKVRRLGKSDAATLNALGSAYRGMSADFEASSPARGEWLAKAEVAYKEALTADKNHGPAYYNLGLLYLDGDPFPTPQGPMDTLIRLGKAKTYFDEYKSMPGVDMKLYDERSKDVTKLIKREEKKRAKSNKS